MKYFYNQTYISSIMNVNLYQMFNHNFITKLDFDSIESIENLIYKYMK